MKNVITRTTVAVATLAAAATLTACGGESTDGTYTGDVTNIETGAKEGTATLELGRKCHWSFTDTAGNTSDARCEAKDGGKKLKLADVTTKQDLEFTGEFNGSTLTLQPKDDHKQMMVLTKTGK